MRKLILQTVALIAMLSACDETQTPLEPGPVAVSLDAVAVAGAAFEYSAAILPPVPGADYMAPNAISDNGTIVGLAIVEDALRPVVWKDGQPLVLPLSPWAEGSANDINNAGDIVGYDDELGAVMWTNGALIALGAHTIGSLANGLNQRGQIVGNIEYETSPPAARGFLWTDGQLYELPPLDDSRYCHAVNVNEAGRIVGACSSRAVLWEDGSVADLGLDSDNSVALAINGRGQIVGYRQVGDNEYRAFVWENGNAVDLPTLGGMWSSAADINDTGQIVGTSQTIAGVTHAVLWEDGHLVDLGLAGGESSNARAINNRGQIVGTAGEFPVLWERH